MSSPDNTVGDFPVKGKILLITGGGSGIGLAFAKLFHAQGGRVVIGDLKLTPDAEAFIKGAAEGSAVFQPCDVADWKSLHALVSASVRAFGDVPDVYCANAGVFEPPWSNFWDDSEEQGYASIRINTEHPIKLTRLAFRALAGAEKKGVVLLVAAIGGVVGVYGTELYCASKHAVVGLCKSLAQADEAHGVKVVSICPGAVPTPLWQDRKDEIITQYGMKKEATPFNSVEETADAMLRLVRDGEYGGGTVLQKTPEGEVVLHRGAAHKLDLTYPASVLAKERGVKWDMGGD